MYKAAIKKVNNKNKRLKHMFFAMLCTILKYLINGMHKYYLDFSIR